MQKRKYELMVIIDPEKTETAVVKDIEKLMSEFDLDVKNKDSWGLRTLAYPIKKRNQGRYVIMDLVSENPRKLGEFNRELLINEDVLRFNLLLRGGE